MNFTVKAVTTKRESFGPYKYAIYLDGIEKAIFTHNYRGEVERIQVLETGFNEDPPFGMCSDFLTGGGPEPLGLSSNAIEYMKKILNKEQT